MSENDEIEKLFEALTESVEKQGDPKEKGDTKKSAKVEEVEEKDTIKGDPIGKAKEGVGLAWWEGIRKITPLVVLLAWMVFVLAVIVIVSSLLTVWVTYIRHLLTDIEGIKSFLSDVYTFLGGVASTSFLFFLNRKPPR